MPEEERGGKARNVLEINECKKPEKCWPRAPSSILRPKNYINTRVWTLHAHAFASPRVVPP